MIIPHDFEMLKDDLSPKTVCAICGDVPAADIHRISVLTPELQIQVSEDALRRAEYVFDRTNDSRMEIVQSIISTVLATPPTVTEATVETMVRAILSTYPDHSWDGIKLRGMVEGLLLSLGVEVQR